MKLIGYWAFLLLVGIFALIPFRLIYIFSDFLTIVFYHVVRYRKKMIINNLKHTFPEKSDKEIKLICRDVYSNLSDILLEAIKGFSMSQESLAKRYQFNPFPELDKCFEEGRSVIGVTAHLGNWEWGAYATGFTLQHHILGVYKKVHHPHINQHLINSRSKFDVSLMEMKETNTYLENGPERSPYLLMLIADQRPSDPKKAYWTSFLGRDTAFFFGPEKFAKQYDLPVFYFSINRVKRGFYLVNTYLLTDKPKELPEGGVLEKYVEILSRDIMERPAQWLWSHSRWKHPKPKELIQD